jgi:hypothetical protein
MRFVYKSDPSERQTLAGSFGESPQQKPPNHACALESPDRNPTREQKTHKERYSEIEMHNLRAAYGYYYWEIFS